MVGPAHLIHTTAFPRVLMRAYPVGSRVGNVRNNETALLDEISVAA
jgi:hypothetical protein